MAASCTLRSIAISSNVFLFFEMNIINGYLSINEISKKWNLTPRRVRTMCLNGQIDGASKLGREWTIPVDAERPIDGIISFAEYKNWRKKDSE